MKFFAFHLMPYRSLDLSYPDSYRSVWVTFPNTYFDPQEGHRLYSDYLDELEYADACGFDGVGVNEHHQNAYGIMPSPAIIAGALSRRMKGKIAILGRALPLLNNPLVVAEEFAMLDQITKGQLIAGFVRGQGAEYHSTGANPVESLERFREAHDLILQAWTQPGPSRYEGKYYDFSYVNTWPRPYQQPHPPVWIPSQGSTETIEWAAAPERRYTYLQTYSPYATLRRFLGKYRETAQRYGYEPSDDQLGWMAPTYVAETDQQAYDEAKPHIEAFINKFLRLPVELVRPPGHMSLASYRMVLAAKSAQMQTPTIDSVIESGAFVIGSVETVRRRLLEANRDLHLGNFLALIQFGTLPHDLTKKNIETFATKVIPWLRERIPDHAAATPI
jgi:alkanesulfonate monooxygenase SsuD/methylene tetrahydromethanopterin reductase-like flavin-dependent oxidoreductase (luciferase family)